MQTSTFIYHTEANKIDGSSWQTSFLLDAISRTRSLCIKMLLFVYVTKSEWDFLFSTESTIVAATREMCCPCESLAGPSLLTGNTAWGPQGRAFLHGPSYVDEYMPALFSRRDKIGTAKNSVRTPANVREGTEKIYDNLRWQDFIEIDWGGMRSLTEPRRGSTISCFSSRRVSFAYIYMYASYWPLYITRKDTASFHECYRYHYITSRKTQFRIRDGKTVSFLSAEWKPWRCDNPYIFQSYRK